MRIHKLLSWITVALPIAAAGEATAPLATPPDDERWSRASHLGVTGWVAALANLKANGGDVAEYGRQAGLLFLPSWKTVQERGPEAVPRLFHRNLTSFKGATVEVETWTGEVLAGRVNRPYLKSYFGPTGTYAGVSVEEYELAWDHCWRALLDGLGYDYEQRTEGAWIRFRLARRAGKAP